MDDDIAMQSLFRGDIPEPGRYFLARIENARAPMPQPWWIVMVVTPDLIPQSLVDAKSKAMRLVNHQEVYPCWLMGKHRFLWIPASRFYYTHASQETKFRDPESRRLFKKYYDLSEGAALSTGIEYFSTEILNDCQEINNESQTSQPFTVRPPHDRRSESGMFFSDSRSNASSDGWISDEDGLGRRKRPRQDQRTPPSPLTSGPPTPPLSLDSIEPPVQVKTEEEEEQFAAINRLPKDEVVTIHVGRKSQEHKISKTDLGKSPLLMSWIKTDSTHPYIMHPDLKPVNNQHFALVMQFMRTGEYRPKIVDIAVGLNRNGPILRKGLDGLTTHDQYSDELVRAGHLYDLAERFQVQGLTELVYTKITETQLQKYSNKSMLTLARNIFSRAAATTRAGDESNRLEKWILTTLAFEFQSIMLNLASLFFKVAAATGRSNFFPRLLRAKAEQVEAVGGEPETLSD